MNHTTPTTHIFKAAAGLYKYGYEFIMRNCDNNRSDVFEIKLIGFKAICMRGEAAAGIFYDAERMVRKGAVPAPVQHTLTGKNAIHTTDGAKHHHRKQMFLSLMTDVNIDGLTGLFHQRLMAMLPRWQAKSSVTLFEESQQALCYAICTWAGVPVKENEVAKRAADFAAMVDAFGSMGLRNLKGKLARRRTEKWIKKIIIAVRETRLVTPPGSALDTVVNYRDETGQKLPDINGGN
jgi:fatty-acid peroxygenase